MHFGADLTFPSDGSVISQHIPILKMSRFGLGVLPKSLECRGVCLPAKLGYSYGCPKVGTLMLAIDQRR